MAGESAVLNIIGAGSAYPETVVDNQLLEELNPGNAAAWIGEHTGITARRSILPLDYIREAGNGDAWAASKAARENPTDLAVRAARQAIERAGISTDQLGLVIGECATAFQTAPSEGQRVAGRLGLKVPAYDVSSAQGPICQHLDMLCSWKDQELPDYVLCVATNCPTYRVNYRSGLEGAYLGDAAGAVIVSSRHAGRLGVFASFFGTDVAARHVFELEKFSGALVRVDEFKQAVSARSAQMYNSLMEKHSPAPGTFKYIGTQFDYRLLERERIQHGLEPQHCWSNVQDCGYSLGSSAVCVLADHWDSIRADQAIVVTQVSPGVGFGYLLLRS